MHGETHRPCKQVKDIGKRSLWKTSGRPQHSTNSSFIRLRGSGATTVRRWPCTTSAGTLPATPSGTRRSTGTPSRVHLPLEKMRWALAGESPTITLLRCNGFCFQEDKIVKNLLPILHQPLNTFCEESLHSTLNLL